MKYLPILFLACLAGPLAAQKTASKPIKAGLYLHLDNKYYRFGQDNLQTILTKEAGFEVTILTAEDIRAGKLEGLDVLIMPGGSGSKQGAKLEESGRGKIRDFVESGGGYVGICAGSYLATNDYSWSIGLINAKAVDKKNWARGKGDVTMKFSDAGKQALETTSDTVVVNYRQGPLFSPGEKKDLPAYETLATFTTEICENGATPGAMIGTTAIARAPFGKGRVICYGPHPERPGGPNSLIVHGVRWAANAAAVSR